ncbi:endonuclease/exonuclease/phosphatase family protein [Photobacterium sp. J15]|uniref:endonuclease/exonuclease/phosphatase family protein n=1 Tax=Photobacterium sp. J15 TaxID=265901 RepID=UPI0007E430D1|nr:endonuclease/exonuclease/phosphatase family protein [Photobacterium sp. J15]
MYQVNRLQLPTNFFVAVIIVAISILLVLCHAMPAISKASGKTNTAVTVTQQPLIIMSWNLQWLSVADGKMKVTRSQEDLQQLRQIIKEVSPDILAFQEVNSTKAIQTVLPRQHSYRIYISDRSQSPEEHFSSQNQFTGFAVRSSLQISDKPDLKKLNLVYHNKTSKNRFYSKLRYGAYIVLYPATNKELHILNVHLKSGCFSRKYGKRRACHALKRQGEVLAQWIKTRQESSQQYLVIGDFNHQLNSQQQWLLTTLNRSSAQPSVLLSKEITGGCTISLRNKKGDRQIRHYNSLIDHALASSEIAQAMRQSGKFFQYHYPKKLIQQFQLSDHCPLILHLPLSRRKQ